MYELNGIIESAVAGAIAITLFMAVIAMTAVVMGDSTPKVDGRLNLNPLKQIEPVGFIMLVFFGYGWGKPMEVSSYNFKDRKTGVVITYVTPIVLGILFSEIIYGVGVLVAPDFLAPYLIVFSKMLMKLSIFNIIPVYPLCGSYILKAYLTPNEAIKYASKERIIQIIVIFLVLLNVITVLLDGVVGLLLGW